MGTECQAIGFGSTSSNMMRSTVYHTSRAARRTESAVLTVEGDKLFVMAGITPNSQKPELQAGTLQVVIELRTTYPGSCLPCTGSIALNSGQ